MSKFISLVVPCYNEAENLPLLYERLNKILPTSVDLAAEFLFINDASTDNTSHILSDLASKDERVKFVEFSRNFGKEAAITAGIRHAQGDAIIMIDADLQHPPELIPQFVAKWQAGADVVIGVRQKNQGEGFIKRTGSFLFYKIMNSIGDTKMISCATDFRLIDARVAEEFKRLTEHNRIARGLIDWLGFKRDYIYFNAEPRKFGRARYSLPKLIRLAVYSFVSHSLFPLKLAGYLGLIITICSGLSGLFIIVEKFVFNDPWGLYFSSLAILTIVNIFLIGVVLSCLGLMALYIANINGEVVNRPIYIVRNKKL